MSIELGGRSVSLRSLGPDDAEGMAAVLADPEVNPWWGAWDAARVRREILDDPAVCAFAVETEGDLAGLVAYSEETDPDYRHAGLDISLRSGFLGRGIGTRALQLLARHLFTGRGHHRLTIDPAVANERAVRCYRRVGFRPVGVMRRYERAADGTWHDNLLMDLLAEDFSSANLDA